MNLFENFVCQQNQQQERIIQHNNLQKQNINMNFNLDSAHTTTSYCFNPSMYSMAAVAAAASFQQIQSFQQQNDCYFSSSLPIESNQISQLENSSLALLSSAESANTFLSDNKRIRNMFTMNQLRVLEQVFEQTHYPDSAIREQLSLNLNLSVSRIQIWFQNRRAKFRKLDTQNRHSSSSIHNNKKMLKLTRKELGLTNLISMLKKSNNNNNNRNIREESSTTSAQNLNDQSISSQLSFLYSHKSE